MSPPRQRADPSPSPSSPPPLLSRLRSAASSFLARQYSTKKGGDGTGPPKPKGGGSSAPRHLRPGGYAPLWKSYLSLAFASYVVDIVLLVTFNFDGCSPTGFVDPSSWRHFDSRAVGIKPDAIHTDAWAVLKNLRREGFQAYLVGGCVRDLLLKRVPKDFDVITTASLEQLKKNIFRRSMIVGKRFPICLLKMRDSVIEISSFRTVAKYGNRSEAVDYVEELNGSDVRDILRWKDSMRRDFTINGLFFNPMNFKIYDYVNGVRDMRKNKVCTVIPAHISFMEDPARILRGFRIAARLGFQFSSETSNAIHDLSSSIINIDKARLMMEMNYIMSYGAAAPSVRLLRKYGLLDILLPFQAAYLSDQMKGGSSDRHLMLMKLLANLDRLLSADRPCHSSLWLALLVFHSTLVISPQDTLVIRAFAAVLYFGTWETAVKFLEEVGREVTFAPETMGPSRTKLDDLMEQTSHLASLVNSSVDTLTCVHGLEQSLARFSEPPQFSGVVLTSNNDRKRLSLIFEGIASDLPSYDERRGMRGIDYWSLKDGDPAEVRFVLGKVIMDTMYDKLPCESTEDEDAAATVEPAADLADGRSLPPLSSLF